jgi:hypothetical protein
MQPAASSHNSLFMVDCFTTWQPHIRRVVRHLDFRGSRHHEILSRAEKLLSISPDEFDKADAIENINKALDQRFRALSEDLQLKRLKKAWSASATHVDMLCSLGAIRPMMTDEVNNIRNAVNHEDEAPPLTDDCRRYAEFAWYLLRVTDSLMQIAEITLQMMEPTTTSTVELTIVPRTGWDGSVSIDASPEYLKTEPFGGNFRVHCDPDDYARLVTPGIGITGSDSSGRARFKGSTILTPPQQLTIAKTIVSMAPLFG